MKKVLVVAALLGVMLLVDWMKQSEATSLAGMGFVMLAAYAVAELGSLLSLPQVTGYILAGVILGPSVGRIISGELVGDMRMFNTLALGLIATSAGLELDVKQMVRLARTLLLTTLIKVVAGVSLVALAFILVETALGLLGLKTRGELWTLALVLAVLSIGTSPSIALAVLNETRAKGRLSDLVLGAAVFKDLVVVIGLAVATAVGRVWLSPGAQLEAGVLVDVAVELGGSIVAGSIVGLIFILYVRFIRAEMLLFVAAMILVVAELCRAVHLELLLVFIASGFVVRNFSKFEHELMRPLRLVALPVFVLFFANAGASVDLATTYQILPLALTVCLVRAGVYLLASRWGGQWAGESRAIRRYAWLAYLPQAGVTLGLVGVAGLQLPQLAGPITTTGMAVVALNLLVGPITLRRALGAVGEIPDPSVVSSARDAALPSPLPAAPRPASEPSPSVPPSLPQALREIHDALAASLRRTMSRFEAEVKPLLPGLPQLDDRVPELEAFRVVLVAHRTEYRELYAALVKHLAALPQTVHIDRPSAGAESRASWPRLMQRSRKLPLRRIARIALGPPLAQLVVRWFETGLSRLPTGSGTPEEGGAGGFDLAELEHGLGRFAELMREGRTRRPFDRRLRYSDVEPRVRRVLTSLSTTRETELARLTQAAWGTALLDQKREVVSLATKLAVQRCLISPALAVAAKIRPAIERLNASLSRPHVWLEPGTASGSELGPVRDEFAAASRAAFSDLAREFRFVATVRTTLAELVASVASVPESIECLVLDGGASLSDGKVQAVPVRAHVDALIRHLMPPIELAARTISTALNQLSQRIDDAMDREWDRIEPHAVSSDRLELQRLVTERLPLATRAIDEVAVATFRSVEASIAGLDQSLAAAYAGFYEDVLPGPERDGHREARLQRLVGRVRRLFQRLAGALRSLLSGPAPLANAQEIRRWLQASNQATLPDGVVRWFDSSPVTDDRIFVGHARMLDYVLDAESSRLEAGRASVLITGTKGSGKSSLLNLCELELPHSLHLRLHASEFGRDVTLFDALATLLDCPPTHAGLVRHLELRAPAVFVDDLPAWISASPNRELELERVLTLLAQTSSRAFWVVSIDTSMLQLIRELAAPEEVFSRTLTLPPLSLGEVRQLVESRLALLSLPVQFPSTRWSALSDRLRTARDGDRFYRRVWQASRGNPGRAVALCRETFLHEDQHLSLPFDAVNEKGTFSYDFSPAQLALLATLHRYGPQPLERLARELAVSSAELWRSLTFLMTTGLLSTVDDGHAFAISRTADWAVFQTLTRARLALTENGGR
jgi:Kef-type K+ transport system membrane component KefB